MARQRKNFDDLIFVQSSSNPKMSVAHLEFSNGYGCNIYLHSPNTNGENPYEFELTRGGHPTTRQSISDENIGYCNKEDICNLLREAQL